MDLTLFKNQIFGGNVPQNMTENQINVISQKQNMLIDENVKSKLTGIELGIAEAGTKLPIKFSEDSELVKNVTVMSKMIARDVGITSWDNESLKYDYTRFYTILRTYYSDLTIEQIKKAFELGMVGMLDDYLPKDREGKADSNHYQRFSVEYYTKILNAFRKKNADVWGKVRASMPKLELKISEEQIKINQQVIINEIFESYIEYQQGKKPDFILSIYINKLIDLGHLSEIPKPKQEDFSKGRSLLLVSNFTSKEDKKQLRENYGYCVKEMAKLKNEAQIIANNKAISLVYDNWVKRGFELITNDKQK